MKRLFLTLACLLAFSLGCPQNGGATTSLYYTIAGAGSANGSNWSNAAVWPPASWSCGTNYYVAGTNGSSYTVPSTASAAWLTISSACTSGTPLNIYKATSANSGSVTGYVSTYGSTQAVFLQAAGADPATAYKPFFSLTGSYVTIDGQTPSGTPCKATGSTFISCTSGAFFGFKFQTLQENLSAGIVSLGGSYNTVEHIEFTSINPYGWQVLNNTCSATGSQATISLSSTNGSPLPFNLVLGDKLYINNMSPTGFNATNVPLLAIGTDGSGNVTVTYASTISAGSGCGALPATATATLSVFGTTAILNTISTNDAVTDNWIHDLPQPIHNQTNGNGFTVERNYAAHNYYNGAEHSDPISVVGTLTNTNIDHNIWEDTVGASFTEPTGSNLTKTVASTSNAGLTATFSGVTWSVGQYTGSYVCDTTDTPPPPPSTPVNGSCGYISSNTSNSITVPSLSGGTNNYFSTGDSVTIYAGMNYVATFVNLSFCTLGSASNLPNSWQNPQCISSTIESNNHHIGVANVSFYDNTVVMRQGSTICNLQFDYFLSGLYAYNNIFYCMDGYVEMSPQNHYYNSGYGTLYSFTTTPSVPGAATLSYTPGGSLPATTYYVQTTWADTFSSPSLGSPEQTIAVPANNVLTVTPAGSAPAWAFGWLPWVSTTSGGERYQAASSTYCTSSAITKTPGNKNIYVHPVCTLGDMWTEAAAGLNTTNTALTHYNGTVLGTGDWLAYWANLLVTNPYPPIFVAPDDANERFQLSVASDSAITDQTGNLCSESYNQCLDDIQAVSLNDLLGNAITSSRGAYQFETPTCTIFASQLQLSWGFAEIGTKNDGTALDPPTLTLKDVGAASCTIGTFSAPTGFSETDTCQSQVIAPGGTCSITLWPSVKGGLSGTLSVPSSSPSSPTLVTLTGSIWAPLYSGKFKGAKH